MIIYQNYEHEEYGGNSKALLKAHRFEKFHYIYDGGDNYFLATRSNTGKMEYALVSRGIMIQYPVEQEGLAIQVCRAIVDAHKLYNK